MSDSEKMDALDLVINVLKEHEKTLDSIVDKMETIIKTKIKTTMEKEGVKQQIISDQKAPVGNPKVNIFCERWEEFKDLAMKAEAISFKWDKELIIKALHGNLYEYREPIQKFRKTMDCEITLRFQPYLEDFQVKKELSKRLGVPENRIIRGEIQIS